MHLISLHLKGFRNLEDLRLEFNPGLNVLVGQNAQGKTNIIEAIGLIAMGSSFRTPEFRDMIGWEATKAEVSADVIGDAGCDRIRVSIDRRKKTFQKNGKRAMPRGKSAVRVVLFAPEEIMLLRSSPGARRRYIDSFISQMVAPHRSDVSKYEKVIRQRNRILSDFDIGESRRRAMVEPWDEQLCDLGARIASTRDEWIARLNEHIPERYAMIAPSDGTARFVYAPYCCGREILDGGASAIRREFMAQLERRRADELARGVTLVGPHRDDLEATVGDAAVRSFGSQGQHRSFVLALKLAEMGLMRQVTREEPILLLDDVASELDCERNRLFFNGVGAGVGQVFITATSEDDVRFTGGGDLAVFDVLSGEAFARK